MSLAVRPQADIRWTPLNRWTLSFASQCGKTDFYRSWPTESLAKIRNGADIGQESLERVICPNISIVLI